MKVLNPGITNWEDVKVSVSVTDLVELLLASHGGIDFDYPHAVIKIMEAQDSARTATTDSGYWVGEE